MKRSLDLFAGAGGSLWAGLLLGWQCVAAVEIDPYCCKVLQARQDDGIFEPFDIHDDIRSFDGEQCRGQIDVITAGFPCQPFSAAGKRLGADDPRNLWPDTARVIRQVRPRWLLLENSPRLTSSGYFGCVLGDLAEAGYDAAWCVLGARHVGAPHHRDRLWIVARLADANGLTSRRLPERAPTQESRPISGSQDVADTNGLTGRLSARQRRPRLSDVARRGRGRGRVTWWDADPADGAAESRVARVVHGVADRRQRERALGNGWVPAVAVLAWHTLAPRLGWR